MGRSAATPMESKSPRRSRAVARALVVHWHFSLENVEAANDRILTFMDKLELPSVYLQDSDLRHTSSDGQRRMQRAQEELGAKIGSGAPS